MSLLITFRVVIARTFGMVVHHLWVFRGLLLRVRNRIDIAVDDGTQHDDVIKWKHFPRYWPFVRGIHQSPVNYLHKGQWRGALMFSLICFWSPHRGQFPYPKLIKMFTRFWLGAHNLFVKWVSEQSSKPVFPIWRSTINIWWCNIVIYQAPPVQPTDLGVGVGLL